MDQRGLTLKSDLNAVETTLAQQNFISLEEVKNEILPNESGFYWIFTKRRLIYLMNACIEFLLFFEGVEILKSPLKFKRM